MNLAWFAGFLDADGSFMISVQRSVKDRRLRSTVCGVHVSQADPRAWVLHDIRKKYGGCITSHGVKKENHRQAYRWSVTGPGAVIVCQDVLPFLVLKRRQAQIIIEHQASKIGTVVGCRRGMSPQDTRISDEVIVLRQRQIEEIRGLNRRGTTQRDETCLLAI